MARSTGRARAPKETPLTADPLFPQPRRIFLHAGFHATGGDDLRRFLWENRAALGPGFSYLMQRRLDPVTQLCGIYAKGQNPLVLAELVDLLDAAIAGAPPVAGGDLVISADGLCGQMPGRRGVGDYSAAPVIAAFLTGYLAERFPAAGTSLIYTTRAPADWRRVVQASLGDRDRAAAGAALGEQLSAIDLEAEVAGIAGALAPLPVYALALEEARTHPLGPGGAFLELADLPEEVWRSLRPVTAG